MKSGSIALPKVIEIELYGPVPTKKNRYTHSRYRARPFKARELQSQIDALILQFPPMYRDLKLEHPRITVEFGFANMRQDRDGALTTLLDILVEIGFLADDSAARCNGVITILPARKTDDPYVRLIVETDGSERRIAG